MVRVGGGWDTLENYLNKHDPCRCNRHRAEKHIRSVSQKLLFYVFIQSIVKCTKREIYKV
jgi:hypothetical protein